MLTMTELCALAEDSGFNVEYRRDLLAPALWEAETNTIWINLNVSGSKEVVAFAHELGHAILGHDGPQDEWGEAYADEVASLLLVSENEYAEAERLYGPHPAAIAEALELPLWVVEARQAVFTKKLPQPTIRRVRA